MGRALRSDYATGLLEGPEFWGATGLAADKNKVQGKKSGGTKARRVREPESHVANALRSAYEEAVKEDVPSEFLDLLGKLN